MAFKNIATASKSISGVCLDQSAYYRGLSAMKGIDLAKYRKEVKAEMQSDDDDANHVKKPMQKGKTCSSKK